MPSVRFLKVESLQPYLKNLNILASTKDVIKALVKSYQANFGIRELRRQCIRTYTGIESLFSNTVIIFPCLFSFELYMYRRIYIRGVARISSRGDP